MPKDTAASASSSGASTSDANTTSSTAAEASAKAAAAAKYADLDTKRESSWPFVLFYIHLNILGLYGVAVLFTNTTITTFLFTTFLTLVGVVGMTCGAHRLWAHQAYTANKFLRTVLMLCQTMAGQVSVCVCRAV